MTREKSYKLTYQNYFHYEKLKYCSLKINLYLQCLSLILSFPIAQFTISILPEIIEAIIYPSRGMLQE